FVTSARNVLVAEALEDSTDEPPVLLRDQVTKAVHVLAFPGNGKTLVVRTVTPPEEGTRLSVQKGTAPLGEKASGRPVLAGKQVILPLANGNLARLTFPLPDENVPIETGPPWRADRAAEDSVCHLVELPEGRLVSSDGLKGLTTWEWK